MGKDVYLKYEPEFLDIFGAPLTIRDPDQRKQREAAMEARAAAEAEGRQWDGSFQAVVIDEPTFAEVITSFINGGPYGEPVTGGGPPPIWTAEDQMYAIACVRAFLNPGPNHVVIEEGALRWLQEQVAQHAGRVYTGTIPGLIAERLTQELTPEEIVQTRKEGGNERTGTAD